MKRYNRRLLTLTMLASGALLASGCNVTDQILETIRFAFGIVDIWA